MSLRIVYFINQYPKVSHSFIRREILALECQGFDILRVALRGWDAELVDEEDVLERTRTKYILLNGAIALLWSVLSMMLTAPGKFFNALWLAIRMGRKAERSWPYHLIYFAEACHMLPWVKAYQATHLHAHFGNNSAEIAMFVHTLGGPPYSFTIHGQDELNFGGLIEKVNRAAFVVTISSFGRSQLYRLIKHTLWHKIKVVHCGLESAFYEVTPVAPPLAPKLVCVGRFSAEKGHLLLLEAVHRLARQNIKIELVLAGDGEMRSEMEKLIAQYELASQIRITGWINADQVRQEILAARALVLPSFSEGLPVVIMEAMALRRPVLATAIAGIPELVQHGKTGWLFPAGSVDELVTAIKECVTLPISDIEQMGEQGYYRVLQRHNINLEATRLARLFRDVSV